MIIDLSPTWRVRRYDRHNFIVEELVTVRPKGDDKPERDEWRGRGFYSSVESAFRALPDHLSKSDAIQTWADLIDAMDALIRGRKA